MPEEVNRQSSMVLFPIDHRRRRACETQATFFASMGAALKMDPLKINIAEFWKVQGCPLAKALRQKFKKSKQFPAKKFKCVYSEELLENKGAATFYEATETLAEHDWHAAKVHTNGTIAHTTAIFGRLIPTSFKSSMARSRAVLASTSSCVVMFSII